MASSGGGGRGRREVRVFDSAEELSTGLAEHVAGVSEVAVRERGSFSLVLSGGSDMLSLLRKLSGAPYTRMVDWSRWYVFWAEENVVPRNHHDSHYKAARDAFLSKVPIAPAKVVPAVAGTGQGVASGESVAEEYEFKIRQLVRSRAVDVSRSSDCPRFDLVLLLLGADSRVALLYPDHPVLSLGLRGGSGDYCPWVAPVELQQPAQASPRRASSRKAVEGVTMTLPVINSAAEVSIIATGAATAEAVVSAVGWEGAGRDSGGGSSSSPAKMVSPSNGKVVWFVDAAAASLLGDHHVS